MNIFIIELININLTINFNKKVNRNKVGVHTWFTYFLIVFENFKN